MVNDSDPISQKIKAVIIQNFAKTCVAKDNQQITVLHNNQAVYMQNCGLIKSL